MASKLWARAKRRRFLLCADCFRNPKACTLRSKHLRLAWRSFPDPARDFANQALPVGPKRRTADAGAQSRQCCGVAQFGHALFGLGRYQRALAAYDKALIFEPQHPTVWKNRSAALQAIGTDEESYIRSARPKGAGAWLIQAGYFWNEQRFAEAIDACDRALSSIRKMFRQRASAFIAGFMRVTGGGAMKTNAL
jgi:tetratricopeptide (TPR) repeat protein